MPSFWKCKEDGNNKEKNGKIPERKIEGGMSSYNKN